MINLDSETNEFIAKTTTDLGKAILTVGFASYFFEKFPVYWRIAIPILGLCFLVAGVLLFVNRKGLKQ